MVISKFVTGVALVTILMGFGAATAQAAGETTGRQIPIPTVGWPGGSPAEVESQG